MITCVIKYTLDPFKLDMFEAYARRWLSIIPRCGGGLLGYWLPKEGTNNVAMAMIEFDNLASYEQYRARLKLDAEGAANFAFAQQTQCILVEDRSFLRRVDD